MEQKEFGGKMIEIDEDGFIQDPEAWDEAVAKDLAKTEGVTIRVEFDRSPVVGDSEVELTGVPICMPPASQPRSVGIQFHRTNQVGDALSALPPLPGDHGAKYVTLWILRFEFDRPGSCLKCRASRPLPPH